MALFRGLKIISRKPHRHADWNIMRQKRFAVLLAGQRGNRNERQQRGNKATHRPWILIPLYLAILRQASGKVVKAEGDDNMDAKDILPIWTQVIGKIWEKLVDEELVEALLLAKYEKQARYFEQMSHYLNLSYPLKDQVEVVPTKSEEQKRESKGKKKMLDIDEMHYAFRHAAGIYPTIYLWAMGCLLQNFQETIGQSLKSSAYTISRIYDYVDIERDFLVDQSSHLFGTPVNKQDPDSSDHEIAPTRVDDSLSKQWPRPASWLPPAPPRKPGFYVMKDDRRKTLVVCIRGTSTLMDALIDLDCDTKQMTRNGQTIHVHGGIYSAAQKVSHSTLRPVEKFIRDNPQYHVVITGHSLGAGVASLLGFLWNEKSQVLKDKMTVYAFASPCVISDNVAEECNDFIRTIVLGTDIVTRLTAESVRKYYQRMRLIESARPEVIQQALQICKTE
ncbi:hypothetical protein RFI_12883, partial [Reticulomyxa filosa]